MATKLQQSQQIQKKSSRMDSIFVNAVDSTVRGLISFAISILVTLFVIAYTKIPTWFLLPIAFLLSLCINPFLSKVKLGEKVRVKFVDYLDKTFKLK